MPTRKSYPLSDMPITLDLDAPDKSEPVAISQRPADVLPKGFYIGAR